MSIQDLANLGEAIGGLGVIVSLLYLAMQIRQNTRAVRSASYHQAAEQLWNYCLALARDPALAELLAKRGRGEALTLGEESRAAAADQALIFGFENMLRLHEEGLVDPEVWWNLIANSMRYLGSDACRTLLASRPGPLSRRLQVVIDAFPTAPAAAA